jgi:hypothetical protein
MIKATEIKLGNTVLYNDCWATVWSVNSPAPSPDPRYNDKYVIELYVNGLIDAFEEELEGVPMQELFAIQYGYQNTGRKMSNAWVYDNGTDWILFGGIETKTWGIGHKKVSPQSLRLFDVEFAHEYQNIISNLK